jgi:hypothetical protein
MLCVGAVCVHFRIEQDDSAKRPPFGLYTYRIYEDDRYIAEYWHDYRGDEHGIKVFDGRSGDFPFSRIAEFIVGGGPEPLRLSNRAQAFLSGRHK